MRSEPTEGDGISFKVDAETFRAVRDGRVLGWSVGVCKEPGADDEPVPIVNNTPTWLEEPDAPQPK